MFRRKILDEMLEWKKSPLSDKKAIVIKGLRQVGKTFIAKEYAKILYENVIYMDFKNQPSLKRIFEGDLDINVLITNITAAIPNVRMIPHKTILIFDEIQECSNARASIKPFMEDGRFDVICTGSLLGIKGYSKKRSKGVPVGFEHTIYLKSMDFEEFLWAKGISENVITNVKECFSNEKPVTSAIHSAMMRYYREYICVGGLPHVVDTFVSTNDLNAVRQEQLDIINEYKDDFGKHLDENEEEFTDPVLLARINNVFNSIPAQLSKENKKFQYSVIEKKARKDEYSAAIQWLIDAGIAIKCNNLKLLQLPLKGNEDPDVFKLYVQDSGLFVAMLEEGTADEIINGDLGIYKGAIFEDMVADALTKMQKELYYYRRESGMEIDFIIRYGGEITLIEVKAGSGKTKSATYVLSHPEIYNISQCIKLSADNVGRMGRKLTVPYYMAFLLSDS